MNGVEHWLSVLPPIVVYLLVAAVIGVESLGVPLPGEIALVSAALLATNHVVNVWWVAIAASAGAIVGDSIGYAIGRRGGRPLLERLGRRFPAHLGPPQLVDGFANGWLIDPAKYGADATVSLQWTPQNWVWVALAVSGAAMLACLAILVVVGIQRRFRIDQRRHPRVRRAQHLPARRPAVRTHWGRSRTTSAARLSSRSPRKRGCRSRPSRVHSAKPI